MENLKERIYEVVSKNRPGTLDRGMIQKALNITSTKEFIYLDKALIELENAHVLYRGKSNNYFTAKQKGFIRGELHMNRKGNGYVDLEDGSSILIMRDLLNGALDNDIVLARITKRKDIEAGENYDEGAVVQVLEHKKTTVVGTFRNTFFGLRFVPDDEKLKNFDWIFMGSIGFKPSEGLKVKAQIESYQPLRVSLVEEIGNINDPGVDILGVLLEHDIELTFNDDVKEEVKNIPTEVSEEECIGRHDLRDETIITIDGNDSKDFDDAISVYATNDGWVLKVSIADVAHYVKEGSALDQTAYNRGVSTYVTDRVVPMLPHELSNGICSLNPNVVRLSNTVEMHVNKDGSIQSFEVYPSVMKSCERMTYEDVNAIYAGDEELSEKYAHIMQTLIDFKDCSKAIRSMRKAKGAIDFDTVESKIICDENGKPIDIVERERGISEECIEDCMIAANVCVAHLMKEHNFPCLYRIHEQPTMKKLTQFANMSKFLGHPFIVKGDVTPKEVQQYLAALHDEENYDVISMSMLRCMSKATYDENCVGHFGLGEEEYLHFTSPIRRYPDLIVHRMLQKYYFEGNTKNMAKDEAKMHDFGEQSSLRERMSQQAEYDVQDMKKAEYMEQFIGQEFEGMIETITGYGFYVSLPNTCEGLVRVDSMADYFIYDEKTISLRGEYSGVTFKPGDKVTVRVLRASKEDRSIDFAVVNSKIARPKKYGDRNNNRGGRDSYKKNDSYKKRDGGFKRDDRSSKDGYKKRDGGFKRDDRSSRDGYKKRDGGFKRDDRSSRDGYKKRDGGFKRDDRSSRDGYKKRDGGFKRDDRSSRDGYKKRDDRSSRSGGMKPGRFENKDRKRSSKPRSGGYNKNKNSY